MIIVKKSYVPFFLPFSGLLSSMSFFEHCSSCIRDRCDVKKRKRMLALGLFVGRCSDRARIFVQRYPYLLWHRLLQGLPKIYENRRCVLITDAVTKDRRTSLVSFLFCFCFFYLFILFCFIIHFLIYSFIIHFWLWFFSEYFPVLTRGNFSVFNPFPRSSSVFVLCNALIQSPLFRIFPGQTFRTSKTY